MTEKERGWLLPPAALFFAGGLLLGRISSSVLFGLLGCVLVLPACFLLRNRNRFCAVLAMMTAAGCLWGFLAWHPSLPEEGDYRITGIVTDELRVDSLRVRTFLSHVTLDGRPLSAGAYWTMYTEQVPEGLAPGKVVSFSGSLYHPEGASNPDGYDFREELLRRGVTTGVYGMSDLQIAMPGFFSFSGWTAALRHDLSLRLIRALGEEAGGYASTMLLGSRRLIAGDDRTAFSRLGIAHVLSVSGFHVGVLISVLAALFHWLHLPQKLRLPLYALFLAFYSALCGFSQPVIRASLLLLLSLYGKILSRPRSSLHLLSAAFLGMLILSPVQLTGLSFQLSFGAVLGLAVITPYLQSLWKPESNVLEKLYGGLCAAMGAQIGILLPELYAFQELPLLGLLANLPMMTISAALILLYWAVLLTLPVPFLSPLLCSLAASFTSWLVSAIRFLGRFPGITLWTRASNALTGFGIGLLFLGLCGILRIRGRHRILLCCVASLLTAVSLWPLRHTSTEYWQFSVGNADAGVLWDRDAVYVIDTGYDDGTVSDFLHRRRLTPDAVILTHLHADHAGGMAAFLEDGIPVPLCYIPDGGEQAEIHPDVLSLMDQLRASGTEIRSLASGDTLDLPSGSVSVLWPERNRTRPNQEANESSLVLRLELMGVSFLQAGDLDGRYEMYAAAPADLLKIAHHGSLHSTSEAFLAAVSPRAVLLSCEKADRHEQTQERLHGIPLYSTATGGALTVCFTPSAFSVRTFLPVADP